MSRGDCHVVHARNRFSVGHWRESGDGRSAGSDARLNSPRPWRAGKPRGKPGGNPGHPSNGGKPGGKPAGGNPGHPSNGGKPGGKPGTPINPFGGKPETRDTHRRQSAAAIRDTHGGNPGHP
ncbi:MAG: hypothetical protein EXR83_03205 [Gammaproteobacteria bacterium]|nr:hypothetical protein [Gammaproteobacteria bacterium]